MPLWCDRREGRKPQVHSPLVPHPSSLIPSGRGFTLVELLVAMTIFSILAAITITAFKGTQDDDRIAAAAQQIKNALEGARSRAIHDKAPRGVRLLRDPSNPTMVNSLQYIALAPSDQSLLVDVNADGQYVASSAGGPDINKVVEYYTSFDLDTGSNPPATPMCVVPIGDTVATWRQLFNQGLLRPGTRIELPKGKGRWYVVAGVIPLNGGASPSTQVYGLRLAEPLETDSLVNAKVFNGSGSFPFPVGLPFPPAIPSPIVPNLEYSLDLGVAPLAGAEPVPLTKGVVIDLDASDIPDEWRPNPANSPPASGSLTAADYPNVDVMFAPNGKMLGAAARAGIFHLYLGNLEEVDKYMQREWNPSLSGRPAGPSPPRDRPVLSGAVTGDPYAGIPDFPRDDPSTAGINEAPQKPTKLVNVLTTSGQVYSSEIDFTPVASTSPSQERRLVVRRLQFAKSGKETP